MTAATLRTLIVEDEPEARRTLREYLEEAPWIEIVGECADGRDAAASIDRLTPDLVILDVHLPELSGLEVLERIRHQPEVVFATAYDQYAVAAFELGALDYLLKPFGSERLTKALARVRQRLDSAEGPDAVERTRDALAPAPLRRLFARSGDRIVPIAVDSIRRIQAVGDYAEVHCASGRHLLHVSLGELLSRLDPDRFRQVHRSHIVNLDHVQQIRRYDERRYLITVQGGDEILASRKASEELRRLVR